jgi:hypothetical protein
MSAIAPFWVWSIDYVWDAGAMKTTKLRADMETRNRIDIVRDHRFGPARPSIRETLHILIEEELDRLDVDEDG